MLKPNLLDLLRVDEGFKVDNLWIFAIGLRTVGKQEGCSAIGANRVTDNCFEGVIDVVAKLSKSRRLALMLGGLDLRERNPRLAARWEARPRIQAR